MAHELAPMNPSQWHRCAGKLYKSAQRPTVGERMECTGLLSSTKQHVSNSWPARRVSDGAPAVDNPTGWHHHDSKQTEACAHARFTKPGPPPPC